MTTITTTRSRRSTRHLATTAKTNAFNRENANDGVLVTLTGSLWKDTELKEHNGLPFAVVSVVSSEYTHANVIIKHFFRVAIWGEKSALVKDWQKGHKFFCHGRYMVGNGLFKSVVDYAVLFCHGRLRDPFVYTDASGEDRVIQNISASEFEGEDGYMVEVK